MPLIPASETTSFAIPGTEFTGLVSPSRGATETAAWRLRVAPGSVGAPHQLTREEIFVALAGTAIASVGGERHTLSAGDALVVPAFTEFSLSNEGTTAFEAVAAMPVGGRAIRDGGQPMTPPWAA